MRDVIEVGVSSPRDYIVILEPGQAIIDKFRLSIESDGELSNPSSIPKLAIDVDVVCRNVCMMHNTMGHWLYKGNNIQDVIDYKPRLTFGEILNWDEFILGLQDAIGRFIDGT